MMVWFLVVVMVSGGDCLMPMMVLSVAVVLEAVLEGVEFFLFPGHVGKNG